MTQGCSVSPAGMAPCYGAAGARECPLVHLQVDIGHDGQNERDRWHLDWVRVTNLTTGETATFNCNRWACTNPAAAPTPALPLCLAAIPEAAEWLSRTPFVRQYDCLHMGKAGTSRCLTALMNSKEHCDSC